MAKGLKYFLTKIPEKETEMELTKERKGEIAHFLLKEITKKENLVLSNIRRNMGRMEKISDFSLEELMEYSRETLHELTEEVCETTSPRVSEHLDHARKVLDELKVTEKECE